MFEKGRNKTGGRKKGTPNKDTKQIKDFFKSLINENQIQLDLEDLQPIERLNFISKILPYILPKAEAEVKAEAEAKINILNLGNGEFEGFNFLPSTKPDYDYDKLSLDEKLELKRLNDKAKVKKETI